MLDIILDSVLYFEGVCAVLAILFFKKYKEGAAAGFIVYIWLTFLIELLALYIRSVGGDNRWLYNILGICEFVILAHLYFRAISRRQKWVLTLSAIGILGVVIEGVLMTTVLKEYLSYSFAFCNVLISVFALLYLIEIQITEKVLYSDRLMLFWVSIGILFFYLVNLPIMILVNVLRDLLEVHDPILLIQTISAIMMYSCFIVGLIWSKQKYNT